MTEFLNALTQISLSLVIPFLWWLAVNKRQDPFFEWLGVRGFTPNTQNLTWMVAGIALTFMPLFFLAKVIDPAHMATSAFSGLGWAATGSILIHAWLMTAASEELFFRGFLTKRFINRYGLNMGLSIQATIFGVLHMAMFAAVIPNVLVVILIGFITAAAAAIMGYTNEVHADGSIMPSWIMHAVGNTIAGFVAAFNLLG